MGLLHEFIASDAVPDAAHSNFYYGNGTFYLMKWTHVLSPEIVISAMIIWYVAVGEFELYAFAILRNSVIWFVISTIAVRFCLFSFTHRSTVHMYPEFALSEHYLWYRFARHWHRLAWSQIKNVTSVRGMSYVSGRGGRIPAGILIYSDVLPRAFSSFALDLDKAPRNIGRALPVPELLPNLSGLEYVIRSRIKP